MQIENGISRPVAAQPPMRALAKHMNTGDSIFFETYRYSAARRLEAEIRELGYSASKLVVDGGYRVWKGDLM